MSNRVSNQRIKAVLKIHRLKSSYIEVIYAVDDFFNKCDPSTATPIEVCGTQEVLCWKINFIWSHSMRLYWSAYELFCWPLSELRRTWYYIFIYIRILWRCPWCNSYMWRIPWCNGYRRRKWTRRYEFKSWSRLIAFHIALIPLGKVWIQLFSLQLWVNSRVD